MKQLSYWEYQYLTQDFDVVVVGGGIVGCSTAYFLKLRNPELKIAVLESEYFGQGASSKNAGFICFGSISEFIEDAKSMTTEEMSEILALRYEGAHQLTCALVDQDYELNMTGATEIVSETERISEQEVAFWNDFSSNAIGKELFKISTDWKGRPSISLPEEGMLNPALMMKAWYHKCSKFGIQIQFGNKLNSIHKYSKRYQLSTSLGKVNTNKIIFATNGLSKQFPELSSIDLQPARNQVLIMESIQAHGLKKPVHYHSGYGYFRPISSNRILVGGLRNLALEEETSTEFQENSKITNALEELIQSEFDQVNWKRIYTYQGILGVGKSKQPIIQELEPNMYCAIRMGGMGVAMGAQIGNLCSKLVLA